MFTNVNRPSAVDVLRPFTVGDTFYADTTSTLAKLADVATGNALISGGVNTAPLWGKIDLTTHVSGVLPSANGGTGVNNAGTLTNASNTTITGGGTLALGGFTLTVPATGTAALLAVANVFTATQTISYDNAVLTVGNGVGSAANVVNGAAGSNRLLSFKTNGVARWDYAANATAESGSNAGSDFTLSAYADNGAYIDDPFLVQRVSGGFFVFNRPIYSNPSTGVVITLSSTDGASIRTEGGIAIKDGITAPSATSGYAKIFVDTADGDLKIIFGDGTTKTIVTDT